MDERKIELTISAALRVREPRRLSKEFFDYEYAVLTLQSLCC